MKLVILLSFLLNLKLSLTYFSKDKTQINKDFDTFEKQSYMEKSTTLNKKNPYSFLQLKTTIRQKPSMQFKATVYLLKDKDPIEEKPQEIKATLKITDSLDIFENHKLTSKVSFLE